MTRETKQPVAPTHAVEEEHGGQREQRVGDAVNAGGQEGGGVGVEPELGED
jgi:hypothetical protein